MSGKSPDPEATPAGHRGGTRGGRAGRLLKRSLVVLAVAAAVLAVAATASGLWLWSQVRASLPPLDGEIAVRGLGAAVSIERDALGIPTIRGASRNDVALATGFAHAQDRFFQMDLLRRRAAGELAGLVGAAALPMDREVRVHRLRHVAGRVAARLSPPERELIESYTAGVNQGLASLGAKPFEYVLLRESPAPWRIEDSVLVVLTQFVDLQDHRGSRESSLGVMADVLPGPLFAFLTPRGTEWDAPLIGLPLSGPPVPGPDVLDLRAAPDAAAVAALPETDARSTPASNNWAVAGSHTAHGGAILANDMHLRLTVPSMWYRAAFLWTAEAPGEEHRVDGATLPGLPAMIVGSNGDVAWGFTNSYGDWSDLVVLEAGPGDTDTYLTPEGPRRFERHVERIPVRGRDDETLEVLSTIWGPVVDDDRSGARRVLRWVAHEPDAVDLGLLRLEGARDVDEAVRLANEAGAPALNLVAADRHGRIGWTLLGRIPRRVGFGGRLPTTWSDGARRWDGWVDPADAPRIVDPESGRLWTANNRTVAGGLLEMVGDGGFDLGARARQIRDRLLALERATERDMLAIQLDDRALFFERWRELLLEVLDDEAVREDPRRAELRRLVEDTWTGRASVDSAGYRLVRGFRRFLLQQVFGVLTAPCSEADPRFGYLWYPQLERPLWMLVSGKPLHLLDPEHASWQDQFLAGVDAALDYYLEDGSPLADRTWGQLNTVRIRHHLSGAAPLLPRWLDMPPVELSGDSNMPRVQTAAFGASQRMVVSPGREVDGFFHMPAGQSGHPMSEHYDDGHEAWVRGEPAPFLPGPPVHTLRLVPSAER